MSNRERLVSLAFAAFCITVIGVSGLVAATTQPPEIGDWTIPTGVTYTCNDEIWEIPGDVYIYGTLDMYEGCNLMFTGSGQKIYIYSGGKIYLRSSSGINPDPDAPKGWSYRKSHTITGTTAGEQTDYQMEITVHRSTGSDSGSDVYVSTNAKSDYGDIRFMDSNDVPLDFWIETSDVNSADIWIEIPTIPVNPGTETIYMYYGNADAVTQSNGTRTFQLFDDFTGTTLDTDKWTADTQGSGTAVSVSSGAVKLDVTDAQTGNAGIKSLSTFTNSISIEARIKSDDNDYIGFTLGSGSVVDENGGSSGWWLTTLQSSYWWRFYDHDNPASDEIYEMPASGAAVAKTNADVTYSGTGSYSTWKYQYETNGDLTWIIDGTQKATATDTTWVSSNKYLFFTQGSYTTSGWGGDQYIDWVLVRKLIDSEPTHTSWGSEEVL